MWSRFNCALYLCTVPEDLTRTMQGTTRSRTRPPTAKNGNLNPPSWYKTPPMTGPAANPRPPPNSKNPWRQITNIHVTWFEKVCNEDKSYDPYQNSANPGWVILGEKREHSSKEHGRTDTLCHSQQRTEQYKNPSWRQLCYKPECSTVYIQLSKINFAYPNSMNAPPTRNTPATSVNLSPRRGSWCKVKFLKIRKFRASALSAYEVAKKWREYDNTEGRGANNQTSNGRWGALCFSLCDIKCTCMNISMETFTVALHYGRKCKFSIAEKSSL